MKRMHFIFEDIFQLFENPIIAGTQNGFFSEFLSLHMYPSILSVTLRVYSM